MTGSTHAKHRSACSPRPTPGGPARNKPIAGPRTGRRGGSLAPLPRRGPAAGTMSPVLGCPPRAPRSHPVEPGAEAPGEGKGTTATGEPTGALRATGQEEAQRTNAGHEACQRGTLPATTTARGQVPSHNGHRVPQTRAARTTHIEPRHRNRCQATANPHITGPSQELRGEARAHTPTPHTPARKGGIQDEHAHQHTHTQNPSQEWRGAAET